MPNFVRATVFIFILGLRPIRDEFSNLGLEPCPFLFAYLFYASNLSRLVLVYLFHVYFVFNYYLSLNVMFVFVSYHIVFFVFIYVK